MKKPWGEEYLVLGTEHLGIWHLSLNPGAKTSLHSHPFKKTSLIVLSGIAEVSFMNGKHRLISGEKIMIRNGVFHSTQAIRGKLEMIEVETPNMKEDLVRLEDAYGRSGQPYEGSENYREKNFTLDLDKGEVMGDCLVRLIDVNTKEEAINRPDSKLVVMSGKLTYKDYTILDIGDIVDHVVFARLSEKFTFHPMKMLEISLFSQ